jgi:hypothetical protein
MSALFKKSVRGFILKDEGAVCEKLKIGLTVFSLHFSTFLSMRYANMLIHNQGISLDGKAADLV